MCMSIGEYRLFSDKIEIEDGCYVLMIVKQIEENKTHKIKMTEVQSKKLSEQLSNINLALQELEGSEKELKTSTILPASKGGTIRLKF